jgi:hypothetical protein
VDRHAPNVALIPLPLVPACRREHDELKEAFDQHMEALDAFEKRWWMKKR